MTVQIGNRRVGESQPCFIVAEAGVNHNGDVKLAHQLIDSAAEAGADAIKFQSFVTEELVVDTVQKARYQLETTEGDTSQYTMLKALELSRDQQAELKAHCEDEGIQYLCTPYEMQSVDMLDELGVHAYKVGSTDTVNIPFLRYIVEKGRPIILSTGMTTLAEVDAAVTVIEEANLRDKLVLLHCTSEYPAPMEEVNLRAIVTMREAFQLPVGFSDHTPSIGASPWAVAIGACVIEKHFTLDRSLPGPDHRASVQPDELAQLVRTVRDVEVALGDGLKRPMPSELANKPFVRKSVVTRRAITAGEIIHVEDLTAKRPGEGLSPEWIEKIAGKTALQDMPSNHLLTLGDVKWP